MSVALGLCLVAIALAIAYSVVIYMDSKDFTYSTDDAHNLITLRGSIWNTPLNYPIPNGFHTRAPSIGLEAFNVQFDCYKLIQQGIQCHKPFSLYNGSLYFDRQKLHIFQTYGQNKIYAVHRNPPPDIDSSCSAMYSQVCDPSEYLIRNSVCSYVYNTTFSAIAYNGGHSLYCTASPDGTRLFAQPLNCSTIPLAQKCSMFKCSPRFHVSLDPKESLCSLVSFQLTQLSWTQLQVDFTFGGLTVHATFSNNMTITFSSSQTLALDSPVDMAKPVVFTSNCIGRILVAYTLPYASGCSPFTCPAGHYWQTPITCLPCPAGSYSNSLNASACIQCPIGYAAILQQSTECFACASATQLGSSSCTDTTTTTTTTATTTTTTSTTTKTTTTTSQTTTTAISDTGCFTAEIQYSYDQNSQPLCGANWVSLQQTGPSTVLFTFFPPEAGFRTIVSLNGQEILSTFYYANISAYKTFSLLDTSISSNSCTGSPATLYRLSSPCPRFSCPTGHYWSEAMVCRPCAAGTYNNVPNSSHCLPCPYQTYSPYVQATSCLPCQLYDLPQSTGLVSCIPQSYQIFAISRPCSQLFNISANYTVVPLRQITYLFSGDGTRYLDTCVANKAVSGSQVKFSLDSSLDEYSNWMAPMYTTDGFSLTMVSLVAVYTTLYGIHPPGIDLQTTMWLNADGGNQQTFPLLQVQPPTTFATCMEYDISYWLRVGGEIGIFDGTNRFSPTNLMRYFVAASALACQ